MDMFGRTSTFHRPPISDPFAMEHNFKRLIQANEDLRRRWPSYERFSKSTPGPYDSLLQRWRPGSCLWFSYGSALRDQSSYDPPPAAPKLVPTSTEESQTSRTPLRNVAIGNEMQVTKTVKATATDTNQDGMKWTLPKYAQEVALDQGMSSARLPATEGPPKPKQRKLKSKSSSKTVLMPRKPRPEPRESKNSMNRYGSREILRSADRWLIEPASFLKAYVVSKSETDGSTHAIALSPLADGLKVPVNSNTDNSSIDACRSGVFSLGASRRLRVSSSGNGVSKSRTRMSAVNIGNGNGSVVGRDKI